MKKILFIHHAGGLGGAPKSLKYLISEIDRNKYKPVLLLIEDGEVVPYFKDLNIEIILDDQLDSFHGTTVSGFKYKRFIRNVLKAIPTYRKAKKIIKNINPEIIHLNTTCLFMFAYAAKKLKQEIKIISHVREPLLSSFTGKILRFMNHRYVDGFVAISKFDLSKIKTKNRVATVVYNFVDLEKYNIQYKSSKLKRHFNLQENDTIFLYLGRISPPNGVIELLNAIRKNPLNKNIYFIIAGFKETSPTPYELKVLKLLDELPNVKHLGFSPDVIDLIASCHFIIAPYSKPHFSRSVIEGAAMGKPSLGSNIGGVNELIEHKQTGYLFNPRSSKSLIDGINFLENLNKEDYQDMSNKSYKYASENFELKKNCSETFSFYNQVP